MRSAGNWQGGIIALSSRRTAQTAREAWQIMPARDAAHDSLGERWTSYVLGLGFWGVGFPGFPWSLAARVIASAVSVCISPLNVECLAV